MTSHATTRAIAAAATPIDWNVSNAALLLEPLGAEAGGAPSDSDGCLLVSYALDCGSSPEEVRRLAEARPGRALVVLARKTEVSANGAIEIMKAGAFDLVLEPIAPEALGARLAVAAEEGGRRHERHRSRVEAAEKLARLTRRDLDVTEALTEGASNKLAAQKLQISPRTVGFYRARIFEKLQIASVAELTRLTLTVA